MATAATECRVQGTAKESQLQPLLELLRGVSGAKGKPLRIYERCQRASGSPTVEIRLQRSLLDQTLASEDSETRWNVRNESVLTRGNLKDLPVTVLTLMEAEVLGPDVPAFWEAFGLRPHYESVKDGYTFRFNSGEQPVVVSVLKLLRLQKRGDAGSAQEFSPGFWLIEVTCQIPSASYVLGVEAIGRVKALLKEFTELQKG